MFQALRALNGRRKVLLFAYMRGGSTISLEVFRKNPEALVWYEPLDAFYMEYFGLMSMWNLPTETFFDFASDNQSYVLRLVISVLVKLYFSSIQEYTY